MKEDSAIILNPLITGPYEFDDETGILSVGLIGLPNGPFILKLSNPREFINKIHEILIGKHTAYEREVLNESNASIKTM